DLDLFARTVRGDLDSYRLRKRYLHADGHVVWGDLSVALVRSPDGAPLHVVSQVLDVSHQHAHEERLEAARAAAEHEHQQLEAVFDAVSVGLLLIGRDGRYERMNRRHRETMNLPFPDGHDGEAGQLGQVFHLDGTTPMTREEMPSYRATQGEEFDGYTYWVGGDPRTRAAFSSSARQVRGPDGERLGAALAYQEITELVRAQRVQDEFVASVSHELRTPLTPVLGHLEILCDHEGLPADVLTQLRVVRRNALRLQRLLADLLHVGEVRERGLELQLDPTDLVAVVTEAVQALGPVAEASGATVTTRAPEQLWARVDALRIRQVLDNLLSNAVKYGGDHGSVHVDLDTVGDSIELEVSDTGMGVDPEEAAHLFGRFFRGDQAAAHHIPGAGLGLNIVSTIVDAHGGTVTVDSRVGHGSTFRVNLPHLAV
ncbi:MAG: sensor signal transduction histidine kinase, partial [Marmoricola sp.]|nr:sensor signal transduction histidine kinase [Marmoricola sp.]